VEDLQRLANMTGAEIYSYIQSSLKRPDKSSEVYLALADTVMDMRARMFSDENAEIATTTTGSLSVGDYKIALPSDFGHLSGDIIVRDDASDTTYLPLKKLSKQQYDDMFMDILNDTASNRGTGVPVYFCFYGNEIYLGPPVDKTTYEFTMNYSKEDEPTYTALTTSIPFTDKFREVVKYGVLFRMFREIGVFDDSDYWRQVYEQGIQVIINNDDQNTDGSVVGVQYHGI
jgi:hypothetical protein